MFLPVKKIFSKKHLIIVIEIIFHGHDIFSDGLVIHITFIKNLSFSTNDKK